MNTPFRKPSEPNAQPFAMTSLLFLAIVIVVLHPIMPFEGRFISRVFSTYALLCIVGLVWLAGVSWRWMSWLNVVFSLFLISGIQSLRMLSAGGSVFNTGFSFLLGLCPIIIAVVFRDAPEVQQKKLFRIIVAAYIVTFFTTLIGVIRNPFAARFLATVDTADNAYNMALEWQNVGGFSFVYMTVVLYPLLISYAKLKKWPNLLRLVLIGILLLFFLKVEYGTALMLFGALSILWIVPSDMPIKTLFCIMGGVVIIAAVLQVFLGNILHDAAQYVDSETLQMRLLYVSDFMLGVENTGDVGLREKVLQRSLTTIVHNPVFGTWYKAGWHVGGHSFVLDYIANYGVAGLLLLIWSYRQIYNYFYKPFLTNIHYTFAMCSFMTAIILSIVNTGSHWFELVLVIPLMLYPRSDSVVEKI